MNKPRLKPESAFNDLRMMMDQFKWPKFPILPIVRRKPGGHYPECAVLCAFQGSKVFHVGMYEGPIVPSKAKFTNYVDFNAIIDDGWRVG